MGCPPVDSRRCRVFARGFQAPLGSLPDLIRNFPGPSPTAPKLVSDPAGTRTDCDAHYLQLVIGRVWHQQAARSENPATRTAAPLERYLEHTGKLNRTNTYGLLRLVLEGPELSRPLAVKCQMAVMKYFARLGVRRDSPEFTVLIKFRHI
jgi:hypothetical protein